MEVGAAIVGLIVAGAQISATLHRFISGYTNVPAAAHSIYQEVNEFSTILRKLQHIVFSPEPLDNAKASLIDTGPISFTLTQCVCTFSELEKQLRRTKLDELDLEGKKLGLWHRMKWNFVEQTLSTIILRIQNHKSSLGILLSVFISESLTDAKELMQDLHTMVAQGVVPLPKKPDSGFGPSPSQDMTQSSSDNDAISIRTTTGSLSQRSQSVLPSLQSALFSSRPYRNRSSSESVISRATSKRRGGSWSLDAGQSNYSVLSLPVSMTTTLGITLAEAPPISQIHLAIPTETPYNPNWFINLYSDLSILDQLLTADERKIWLAPSPEKLNGSLLLNAVYKGLATLVFLLLLDPSTPKDERTRDKDTALDLAIENAHVAIAQMLLAKGADVNSSGEYGYMPLHRAITGRSLSLIQLLLDAGAYMEARTGPLERTPLHLAAGKGSFEVIALLIYRGANIEANDMSESTPLHLAALGGYLETAGLLLDRGANINKKTAKGYTPLHLAVERNSPEVAGLLLDRGANIDEKTVEGYTPLHLAVQRGYRGVQVVRLLLDKGANVDISYMAGYTSLHLAVDGCSAEIASLLLQSGASIDAKTAKGYTPLHLAIERDSLKIAGLLLDWDANVDAMTMNRYTPLHLAVKRDSPELVKAADGYTPLHLAVERDSHKLVILLLARGANIDAKTAKGYTPLHLAIERGSLKIAGLLLDWDANVDAMTMNRYTPLHLAVKRDSPELAVLLLARGANIEVKAADEYTPLHLAIERDSFMVAGHLLSWGANVDAMTVNRTYTPLHLAVKRDSPELVALLLARGANIDVKAADEYTPLHLAVQRGYPGVVRLLLNKGANVDTASIAGHTSLHLAVDGGSVEITSLLLDSGANIDAKTVSGETPLHLASNSSIEILELLVQAGANIGEKK